MISVGKLNILHMKRLKSSWSLDRVAASACNRRPAKKQGPRPSALYAQYKVNTDTVTVFTRRGREVYTRQFGDVIVSARIEGDTLKVETENGGHYVCNATTGELLEADFPANPGAIAAAHIADAKQPEQAA